MPFPDATVEFAKVEDWSDPLVGLQVQEFRQRVTEFDASIEALAKDQNANEPVKIVEIAEYLCEWSRNLLNRTFGRTTPGELDQITSVFAETADHIKNWAKLCTFNDLQTSQIQAYADHIEQRTGQQK